MTTETEPSERPAVFALAAGLAWIGGALALGMLTFGDRLRWDEVEFVRATEWVRQGLVPYRDFWEHHSPLQWFVFAPFKALATGPGVATVVFLRWMQVPFWLLALWALWRPMRAAGSSRWAAATAMAAVLASPVFVHSALQYRVDTLSTVLYVLALFALQASSRSRGWSIATGVLLSLTGLANLRMGPIVAATFGLAMVFDPPSRAWRLNRRFAWVAAGALLGLLPALAYLLLTRSLAPAWQRLIVENSMADGMMPRVAWGSWKRALDAFAPGLSPAGPVPVEPLARALVHIDWSAGLLLFGGAVGIALGLTRFARAGFVELLAIVQLVSLWFTQRMKALYPYHFEVVLLLFVPLFAFALDWAWSRRPSRLDWRWLPLTVVMLAAARNGLELVRSNEVASLRYQDRIMREADRWVPPEGAVFDGVGFALNRRPAYRYWFLPLLVRYLTQVGVMEPYTVAQMTADPPDAVIYGTRVYNWFHEWPELGGRVVTHYLPLYHNLWIPGLSARIDAAHPSAEWIVPRTGRYVVVDDARLVNHPWFLQPLLFALVPNPDGLDPSLEIAKTRRPGSPNEDLRWELDGAGLAVGEQPVLLRRGQKLHVSQTRPERATAILVVPVQVRRLFVAPPKGALLDG